MAKQTNYKIFVLTRVFKMSILYKISKLLPDLTYVSYVTKFLVFTYLYYVVIIPFFFFWSILTRVTLLLFRRPFLLTSRTTLHMTVLNSWLTFRGRAFFTPERELRLRLRLCERECEREASDQGPATYVLYCKHVQIYIYTIHIYHTYVLYIRTIQGIRYASIYDWWGKQIWIKKVFLIHGSNRVISTLYKYMHKVESQKVQD